MIEDLLRIEFEEELAVQVLDVFIYSSVNTEGASEWGTYVKLDSLNDWTYLCKGLTPGSIQRNDYLQATRYDKDNALIPKKIQKNTNEYLPNLTYKNQLKVFDEQKRLKGFYKFYNGNHAW